MPVAVAADGLRLPSLNSRSLSADGDGWIRKEVVKATWGEWLSSRWRWDWWVTLTFDPRKGRRSGSHGVLSTDERTGESFVSSAVGWAQSSRLFHEWLTYAVAPVQTGADGATVSTGSRPVGLYWLRGREPNPYRYGTHFHALVGGVPSGTSRRRAWEAWFTANGAARIEPYDSARGAGFYVSKYVVKTLGDLEFSENAGEHMLEVQG